MLKQLLSSALKQNNIDPRRGVGTRINNAPPKAIRVTIVQPSLAKYRVSVFRELASRPGLDVRVLYGKLPGLENVTPEGFRAMQTALRRVTLAGLPILFQSAHWSSASRRVSDVLMLQWSARHVTVFPSLLRAKFCGVPTVLWGHGYSKSRDRPRQRLHQWLARFATALLFYDPRTRDSYIQQGWNPHKLFVALNCLDHYEIVESCEWWLQRRGELSRFRAEQGIDAGPMILFVSRLQPANRVDLLIEATALLLREIPTLKTVIIGNGAAEKAALEKRAASLGITNAVMFQDGIYDERKLAPWFLSADVFCYPSNIGLSLLHALWYGLPVVTTDNLSVQNPEIVALENEVNGLTYEHENVSSLASQLRRVLCDANLRRSLSEAARRSVEGRFTIRNMVDGLESAIRYAYQKMQLSRRR